MTFSLFLSVPQTESREQRADKNNPQRENRQKQSLERKSKGVTNFNKLTNSNLPGLSITARGWIIPLVIAITYK